MNTIKLNIGLATQSGPALTVPEVIKALASKGLLVIQSRLALGEWQGIEEKTLAVECISPLPLCHHECRLAIACTVQHLAGELRQACIALQWPDGSGVLLPEVAPFDPAFFHDPAPDAVGAVELACRLAAAISNDCGDNDSAADYKAAAETLQNGADNLRPLVDLGPGLF